MMRNPFESHTPESFGLGRAYERAEKALQQDVIDMEQFEDLYGQKQVERDRAYVEDRKTRFERDNSPEEKDRKRLATIFEAIMHEQIELSDWLGPEAHTVKTCEFDDIANGVDEIVEVRKEEEGPTRLALAIDVTFNAQVERKMQRICDEDIGKERLARVKYFYSEEEPDFRGELSNVPRVVVGIGREAVRELAELWMQGEKQALARHPVQWAILEEIQLQVHAFRDYAAAQDKSIAARAYERAARIVDRIVQEKGAPPPRTALQNDEVLNEIRLYLERLPVSKR